jgi:hypothetical protein
MRLIYTTVIIQAALLSSRLILRWSAVQGVSMSVSEKWGLSGADWSPQPHFNNITGELRVRTHCPGQEPAAERSVSEDAEILFAHVRQYADFNFPFKEADCA